ncbi:MAG: helix-turn-helix domain-containing protein [Burkholderiales bacterium]|nr:helix-turn-helix domain-containing protein [Burkholderiales bacterium]
MSNNELSPKELALINNIISKLQIHMDKTEQTLYSLSATLGFEYQPFYRLMKNKKLPTISSIAMITEHLQCSIEDLISDKILVEVSLIDSIENIQTLEVTETTKVPMLIQEYLPYIHNTFVALKIEALEHLQIEHYKLYCKIDQINTDGVFIARYQGQIVEFNVISTSSTFIIVENDNNEQRIPQDQIEPIAKFFNNLLLFEAGNDYLQGVKQ